MAKSLADENTPFAVEGWRKWGDNSNNWLSCLSYPPPPPPPQNITINKHIPSAPTTSHNRKFVLVLHESVGRIEMFWSTNSQSDEESPGVWVWRVSYSRIAPQKNKWNPRFNKYHLIKSDHSQLQCKQTSHYYLISSTIFRRNKTYTRNKTIYIQKSFDIIQFFTSRIPGCFCLLRTNPSYPPIQVSNVSNVSIYQDTNFRTMREGVTSPGGSTVWTQPWKHGDAHSHRLHQKIAIGFCLCFSVVFLLGFLVWCWNGLKRLSYKTTWVYLLFDMGFPIPFSSHVMVFWMLKTKIFPNQNKGERVPVHFKGTETISVNCQLFLGGTWIWKLNKNKWEGLWYADCPFGWVLDS